VTARIAADRSVLDAAVYPGPDVSQTNVLLNRTRLEELEVSARDVVNALETYYGSPYVNNFNQFGRSWQVEVRLPVDADRIGQSDLTRFTVPTRNGNQVPLSAVLTVEDGKAPPSVLRVGTEPALRITASPPDGKTTAEAIARCLESADAERKKLNLPPEYRVVDLTDLKPR
jgi:multidrug efflux pump subunit AcrB